MTNNVAKIKLNKVQLKDELKLPPQAEILAALVVDTELVLYVKHPHLTGTPENVPTPELTLADLRCAAPEVI